MKHVWRKTQMWISFWLTFVYTGIRKTPTRKILTHQTPLWWIPPRKIPTRNIPTHVFKYSLLLGFFFHYCHRYHWHYLKNCFVILCSKSQSYCGVLKKCSLPAKIVTYSKRFCWSSMIIGHYHIHLLVLKLFILETEECDVTQFNHLNLNSSFSHRAINQLIKLLIYLQKWKQLLRFGLLHNIKVIEETQ